MKRKEKITKKIICFITIALVMSSCQSAFYTTAIILWLPMGIADNISANRRESINHPKNKIETITFDSLPTEIKELFYISRNMPEKERRNFHARGSLYAFSTAYEYESEILEGKRYFLLIDKTNNISYTIERGKPFPIIIFDEYVFIVEPCRSSGFSYSSCFTNWLFNRYSLDGAMQTRIRNKKKGN